MTTPSTSFDNPTLTQNIGFTAQSPQNIGFNIPSPNASAFGGNTNGFNGNDNGFNHFNTQNQGSATASPSGDLDEFDIISNRNKIGSSPQPTNNGS